MPAESEDTAAIDTAAEAGYTRWEGYNGQLDIGEHDLILRRDGLAARATFGKVEPRHIPLAAIGDVRMRPATYAVNGWVQLVLGGLDAPDPGRHAPSNADVVLFTYTKRARLVALHEQLAAIVAANRVAGIDPAAVGYDTGSSRATRGQQKAEQRRQRLDDRRQSQAADRSAARAQAAEEDARRGRRLGRSAGITLYQHWIDGGTAGSGPTAGARASIDSAGNIDRRLSLTRVVATGGLGLFWKKKVDKRELYLLIEGNGFAIVKPVNPEQGLAARTFAASVTAAGAAATQPPAARPTDQAAPTPGAPGPAEQPTAGLDQTEQIRGFAQLRDDGLLSEEEFTAKKAQILGLG